VRFIYVADPLCSWCYGFGPELAKLLEVHREAPVEVVMGGLRPYNTQPMSEAFRTMLRGHWEHVAQASGLPFSADLIASEGFVYDTEPACRAVVTARALDSGRTLALLKAVQSAFYRDARDVTRPEVLADIAAECGFERARFLERLESEAMREGTRRDFAQAQAMGVSGFPTLGVGFGDSMYLLASGFATAAVLEERLAQIERAAAA
jgi:putative protein-disulfide isomerase